MGHADLFDVIDALNILRFDFGATKRGEQQGRENGYNSNDNEEFDQGERVSRED